MINNNKILTVSYGTFSCTLEGFEDSFGTMKAIAEYFRDLAADDRYFGAEPPQPDAEMLARIAQKEVSRRVEARQKDGQIFLSALEDTAQTQVEPVAPAKPVETPAEPALAEAIEIKSEAPAAPVVTATTAGIAAVVAAEAQAASPTPEPAVPETAEAPATIVADFDAPEAAEIATAPEPAADIVPGHTDAEVEAFFEDAAAEDAPDTFDDEIVEEVDEIVEDIPAPAAPAPDSIAAKLQRIRAVVAQQDEADEDEEQDEDFLEDEHAQAEPQETAEFGHDVLADARADIEDALDADGAADDEAGEGADVSDILKRVAQSGAAQPREDSILSMDDEDALSSDEAAEIENFFDEADEADLDAVEDGLDAALEADAPEAPRDRKAQVIKVARAKLDAAIEAGELEEYEDDLPADEITGLDELDLGESSLSADDEDELAQELAAVEADLASMDEEDDEPDDQPVENVRRLPARQTPQAIDDDPDSDVGRLMAETDSHMDDPDAATRRDAFAQLRAAVAAQKADTAITGRTSKADSDEAYRDDLAEVVRPRRPTTQNVRTERPAAARPAPLKLVAEQRIDVEQPKTSGPVRPRRIAAVADAPETVGDVESFADFAADMGAAGLPDLLEAAAAYMSFVEGREEFSRPQLMNTVRQADPEDFSREDGLRSFGQLLRSGKIEKIDGGRFTVSDQIGFRPGERAVG